METLEGIAEKNLSAVPILVLLVLVQSALQTIFQMALYLYAREGRVPGGFRTELLSAALS